MVRSTQWVGASALAEEFGFTSRHWTRMASAGRVPGARQPFGPGSSWVFDIAVVRDWWKASEQRPEAWYRAMSALFEPMRAHLIGRELSVDEIIALMKRS